ncbi:hypothetical protein ACSBR2_039996 [Camellia fascicularis]
MADDIPHDRASLEIPPQLSLEMEAEPEPVGFARGAPEDLLLREPDSHLSYGATEVYAVFLRFLHWAMEPRPCGTGIWSSLPVSATLLMRPASVHSARGYHAILRVGPYLEHW